MTEKKAKESSQSSKPKVRVFHVGDLAVYPAHGVGEIQAIESRVINGEKHDFYIMKIVENGMVIMIPTWNVESVGLRDVVGKKEIPKIMDVIKSKRELAIDNQTWNRRYREYMDKIKTGSVFELAEVLRDLFILREDKELSFGERKMLDTARSLLVKEMSIAQDLDESQVEKDIHGIFGHEI